MSGRSESVSSFVLGNLTWNSGTCRGAATGSQCRLVGFFTSWLLKCGILMFLSFSCRVRSDLRNFVLDFYATAIFQSFVL